MTRKGKEIVAGYCWPGRHKEGDNPWNYYDNSEYQDEVDASPRDEVILPKGKYTLEIDYPLSTPFRSVFTVGKEGMTRQKFADFAASKYQFIYSFVQDGMESNSNWNKYGIWGHGIGDLTFHTLYVDEDNLITLGVDS